MTRIILVVIFIIIYHCTLGQRVNIDYTVHSRVDTTNSEIKEILNIWIRYLSSKPDKITNSPYWNSEEKEKYADFDLSRRFIYQFPSEQLLQYYKPTILSIEKEGYNYSIRTLLNAENVDKAYKNSNPWCIIKLYATKENNEWKLKNALPIITEKWTKKTVGKITFIYSPEHNFNIELAINANAFCDKIAEDFQFEDWKPFDFYITKSADELGSLLGFDFFFAGYTTGIALHDQRILLSGFDSEWYPHEFIHMVVLAKRRHRIIDEGFATWQGGAMNKQFLELVRNLAFHVNIQKSFILSDILEKNWGHELAAFYTTGALICKLVYEKGGVLALKRLQNIPEENKILRKELCDIFEINDEELDKFIKDEILRYLNQ